MRSHLALSLAAALVSAAAAPVQAQQPGGFDFSIKNIMRGPELYGRAPQRVQWTPDGRWIYFTWNEPGTDWRESLKPYRVRAVAGSKPERVSDIHMDSIGPVVAEGSFTRDRRAKAVSFEGDLYVVDQTRAVARRLTETVAAESNPTFSADGRRVYFVRDNNVFSLELDGGLVRQLTDVRSGPAPREDSAAKGQRGVLEAQQRELFDVIRDRLRSDSISRADRKLHEGHRPKPLYLMANERVTTLSVSPTGRAMLLVTTIPAQGTRETEVPQYVTSSGYAENLRVRTKVGDAQSAGRIAFVDATTGDVKWLKVTPDDTTKPPAAAFAGGWNDAGDAALVFATRRDYKARYIHTVDAKGTVKTIDTLRDSAWVVSFKGGDNTPCFNCFGWLDGGARAWFVSEADGYAHIYTTDPQGGDRRQLTSGKWEVLDATLSPDRRSFFLSTSEESPFEMHFYRMPIAGGAREKLTSRKGGHSVTLSPDAEWMADVHSTANRPPELFVGRTRPGAELAQLTTSPSADWLAFKWVQPEIVMIPASDGKQVPARIYRPKDWGAQPNGSAAIFVHGAGYLHNVHNYWSTYAREYMFNQYLASKGYVVLDIDYRGSAGYGRDWRTAIYRHMGGRDLQDHVDGSRYLQKELGINPERIGLYGGSYGGFITLMALFNAPKDFGAGAALRSVTDWAHYNHQYTAQILNTPEADSIAYKRSSPIYFAQGLEDPLLMAHGMVDVNVHFQDIVRLTQRLVELEKTGWELAVYPVEDHGFVRPSSWYDEYRRIFELFERALGPQSAASVGGR